MLHYGRANVDFSEPHMQQTGWGVADAGYVHVLL
jgi:hypothetical protein